ncbi:MAG TPA: hypothetical protein VGN16_13295 [Acidobacteriaceae bacterium]|jgi:hypothetical protein
MQILSAVDAISPAFERMKLVMFSPFRKGRTWKLGITGYLSFAGTIFLPFSLIYALIALMFRDKIPPVGVYIIIAAALTLTALYVFIFVLCSRLQFAFFDIVLNRGEFVAPAWRKYGPQSWRWTSVKIIAGTIVTLLLAWPIMAGVQHMIRIAPALSTMSAEPGQPPPPQLFEFIIAFYGMYFAFFAVFGIYYLVAAILSSFMVPTMALEDASVKDSFRRFIGFVRRETAQFFLYIIVRFGLGLVGYMGVTMAFQLVLILVFLISGVVLGAIGLLLHVVGVPNTPLFVLGGILFFLIYMGSTIYIFGLGLGAYFTFFEAHTLYFLGGRYPKLGELLEKSTPPPPPPAYWPPNLMQAAYPPPGYPSPAYPPPSDPQESH